MQFKEFLKMVEAGMPNPMLKGVSQQVSNNVNNMANAPSNGNKTAGQIAKDALLNVAKTGKAAEIEALTNQVKNPLNTKMMKKKMKKK